MRPANPRSPVRTGQILILSSLSERACHTGLRLEMRDMIELSIRGHFLVVRSARDAASARAQPGRGDRIDRASDLGLFFPERMRRRNRECGHGQLLRAVILTSPPRQVAAGERFLESFDGGLDVRTDPSSRAFFGCISS